MQNGYIELLTPANSALILIDHQSPMLFGVQSHDRSLIVNNAVALAKAAKAFKIPTILTTVSSETLTGPLFPELTEVLQDLKPLERTAINPWDDAALVNAVKRTQRRKLIFAGLWTSVSVTQAAISALRDGFEPYMVADASGDVSRDAHNLALHRLVQVGVTPTTWQQVMYELQRDWSRGPTAELVNEIVRSHFGAFGEFLAYSNNLTSNGQHQRKPAQERAERAERAARAAH